MNISGNLSKMRSELNSPIDYYLKLGENEIHLNDSIGKEISLEHNGVINCMHCGKKTKKSFSQGLCYACFQTAPEADQSVMRPELSMAQFGIARDMEWAAEHDLIDHYVYLSVTNDIKVGVTRFHQIPTRWIDQGAVLAIKLAKTPNRHIAGIIEKYLKSYVADITKWQAMLKEEMNMQIDLKAEKMRISDLLPLELKKYLEPDDTITSLEYPGDFQLKKINTVGFDKTPLVKGRLVKIKGQYLIFEDESVMNIRKYSGYFINFSDNR
ncbi:MAG: DUF2797 domain-containing protein [Prolixibacteraceae bacterium]